MYTEIGMVSNGSITCISSVAPSQQTVEESPFPSQPTSEEETTCRPATTNEVAVQSVTVSSTGLSQAPRAPLSLQQSCQKPSAITLEQAVQHQSCGSEKPPPLSKDPGVAQDRAGFV